MNVESNISKVIDNIIIKLQPAHLTQLVTTVSQSVYASSSARVFNRGMNVNERPLWRYSTKPIYVNPSKSPKKFPTGGKASRSGEYFENGKKRHTRYFTGGYKDFRNKIGRRIDVVDLQLTGRLRASYQMVISGNSVDIGFISSKEARIAQRHEQRFGCIIFGLSEKDKKDIQLIMDNFTSNLNK